MPIPRVLGGSLDGGAVSYERGTPVEGTTHTPSTTNPLNQVSVLTTDEQVNNHIESVKDKAPSAKARRSACLAKSQAPPKSPSRRLGDSTPGTSSSTAPRTPRVSQASPRGAGARA